MICNLCNSTFSNLNLFISHLNYQHGISDKYNCSEISCHRVFNRRNPFKRHIILNHTNNTETQSSSLSKHNSQSSPNISTSESDKVDTIFTSEF